ncbi:hypothetical protein QWY85_17655 [Neolewinella lacunae]|uniref:Uncharacterized protein n=1 Tax=Neolewinella lacunae TaxID=1517758 RepID=A0A923PNS1_9BACT|nr:carboxypeptidase-like regulatory domain-containing protein [Neolewinella lacunae]MBC6995810.1 hypothetical protein [Neolewinella lacunae]MDN3636497.1 hypothetical protein [Neolewinella lacunae]
MPLRHLSTAELLRRYLNGALTAPEEAELERRAREDDATAEALQGLRQHPAEDHLVRTQRLKLAARAAASNQAVAEKKKRPLVFYLSAAAAVLLLVTAIFLLPRWTDEGSADLALRNAPEAAPATEDAEADAPLEDPEATEMAPAAESLALEAESPSATREPAAREAPPSPAPASNTPLLRPRPAESVAAPPPPPPPTLQSPASPPGGRTEKRAPARDPERTAPAPVTAAPARADAPLRARTQAAPAPAPMEEVAATSAPSAKLLEGRITSEDGQPIANALVRLPGLPLGERTDTNGIFRLEVDAVASVLEISHPEYEAEQLDLNSSDEDLQISLEKKQQSSQQAPEVAWGVTKVPVDQGPGLAIPEEGYQALRQRIEANRPADVPPGKVKLSFLVHPDGRLSNFVFRGRPSQATMDYVGGTIARTSIWEVLRSDDPVRVYFKVVLK